MTISSRATDQWGIFVNEVGIFANRGGSDWWVLFCTRFQHTDRITTLELLPVAGGQFFVAYDDKDDAELGHALMVEQGVRASFLKVTTLAAARKTVRTRHAKYEGHENGCVYCRLADEPGTGKTNVLERAA